MVWIDMSVTEISLVPNISIGMGPKYPIEFVILNKV